ncbi:MAG: flagellar hook-basal body complex protein FliE [Desulfobacterales bacterium]|jgi:flagellar hook-basal body complex protein FliE
MQDISIDNQFQPHAGQRIKEKAASQSLQTSFGELLRESISQVSRLQHEADANINDLAAGRQIDIHQTMIAVEKAEVSFELLMQIRNKVIAAYETIMRTQV